MRDIFKSSNHNSLFQSNGFVRFPLLEPEEVSELKALYHELGLEDKIGYGYLVGMNDDSISMRKEMQGKILEIVSEKIEASMVNRKLYTATFMVKLPSDQNYVPPHQDWTFTENEDEDPSIMIWIALDDVSIENGALGFVKGSHKITKYPRVFPFPVAQTPVEKFKLELFDQVDYVEMKAGEIVVFDNRTIHASQPNRSKELRMAIGLSAYPRDKDLIAYTLKPNSSEKRISKWKVDEQFFVKYNNPALAQAYNNGDDLSTEFQLIEEVDYPHGEDWNLNQTIDWVKTGKNL